jgi:hypothetical protein
MIFAIGEVSLFLKACIAAAIEITAAIAIAV